MQSKPIGEELSILLKIVRHGCTSKWNALNLFHQQVYRGLPSKQLWELRTCLTIWQSKRHYLQQENPGREFTIC